MRYLLSDVLLQNQGVETTTEVAQPARIVPDYYTDLITPRAATAAVGYLIKTHDMIAMLQDRIGGDPGVRQCRYLYLFQNPRGRPRFLVPHILAGKIHPQQGRGRH